jgi:hypothetical protein
MARREEINGVDAAMELIMQEDHLAENRGRVQGLSNGRPDEVTTRSPTSEPCAPQAVSRVMATLLLPSHRSGMSMAIHPGKHR